MRAVAGEAAFVEDFDRGAIVHRILNIIDTDVVAKDRTCILVIALDGRAGEADEGRHG